MITEKRSERESTSKKPWVEGDKLGCSFHGVYSGKTESRKWKAFTKSQGKFFTLHLIDQKAFREYSSQVFKRGGIQRERVFYSAILGKKPNTCKISSFIVKNDTIRFSLDYTIEDEVENWNCVLNKSSDVSENAVLRGVVEDLTKELNRMKYAWRYHRDTSFISPQHFACTKTSNKTIQLKVELKSYYKVLYQTRDGNGMVGIATVDQHCDNYPGQTEYAWALHHGNPGSFYHKGHQGGIRASTSFINNDIVTVRIDRVRSEIVWEIERGGQDLGTVLTYRVSGGIPTPVFPAVRPFKPGSSMKLLEIDGISFE